MSAPDGVGKQPLRFTPSLGKGPPSPESGMDSEHVDGQLLASQSTPPMRRASTGLTRKDLR